MRPSAANCRWILLLLCHSICGGLTGEQTKNSFKTQTSSSNSLMEKMMDKFSYPKSEVTAGVGYGHHLHPFYYLGRNKKMYPCAVECGEWETMGISNDNEGASSDVDVVKTRPDVSTIEITTPKPRPYKDVSSFRMKKYISPELSTPPPETTHDDYTYQDSKVASLKLNPQRNVNGAIRYSDDAKELPNDGSLYSKYQEALLDGHVQEVTGTEESREEDELYDPLDESLAYNSPSFHDTDGDDVDAPVYPTHRKRPSRERIEEKYIKHKIREEHLEDLRTDSLEYPNEEDREENQDQRANNSPVTLIDDFAAPKQYNRFPTDANYGEEYRNSYALHDRTKPFRPSPALGQIQSQGQNHPHQDQGYSVHEYEEFSPYSYHDQLSQYPQRQESSDDDPGVPDENSGYKNPHPKLSLQGIGSPTRGHRVLPQDNNFVSERPTGQNYAQRHPRVRKRPAAYGKYLKHPEMKPPASGLVHPYENSAQRHSPEVLRFPTKPPSNKHIPYHYGSPYPRSGRRPSAPKYIYPPFQKSTQQQMVTGGIRVVPPPRRPQPPEHSKWAYYNPRPDKNVESGPYRNYGQTTPGQYHFTRMVKSYRNPNDRTPKRYIH